MKTPWAAVQEPEKKWSPQQRAVFEWFGQAKGNLVVRARAGTGKTTTILEGIKHIPCNPRILLCAFNKRIQVELQGKLQDDRAEAKTLHALGFGFLRQAWGSLKIDDAVEESRIADVAGAVPSEAVVAIRKLVSVAKGAAPYGLPAELEDLAVLFGCEVEGELARDWTAARVADVAYKTMIAAQTRDEEGRITFDDMLYIPVVCKLLKPSFDWVLVDEAQDMNVTQLLMAQRVVRASGHVVVVGDDKQAIYGFRGADSGSIDRLKTELGAEELGLTTTYRCPQTVVAVAQELVPDYYAAPEAPQGYVAHCTFNDMTEWLSVGDAVLSRINAPLVSVALRLIRKGVAARIEGRDIGKTLGAIVRKMRARSVPEFLERVRGWEDKQRARVKAGGRQVEERLRQVADQGDTLRALAEGCSGVEEIGRRCETMFSDSIGFDGKPQRTPAVVCSSVHKAKGLEWSKVFILEKTLYCGGRKKDQEEHNIFYVAVTRSKETLVFVRESHATT